MADTGDFSLPGSPSRTIVDNPSQDSYTSTFVLEEPSVEAVYPSFIIVSWRTPKAVDASHELSLRTSWKYVVEWQGTHGTEVHTTTLSVCHVVVPIEFTNESYFIRVVAKGTMLIAVDQVSNVFVTAKITVPTRRKSHLPWLLDGAATSALLRDSLIIASLSQFGSDITPMWGSRREPIHLGRGTLKQCAFTAFEVQYDAKVVPLSSEKVVFVATELSTAQPQSAHSLTGVSLVRALKQENTSLVFTGIGAGGSAASYATHRLLASLLSSNDESAGDLGVFFENPEYHVRQNEIHNLARRVFCITFGSPREDFFANGIVLSGTAAYSGQFLHFSGSVATAAKSSGFFPAVTSSPPRGRSTGAKSSRFLSVPLGIRVGPIFDVSTKQYYLRAAASQFERRSEEEDDPQFDVLSALTVMDCACIPQYSDSLCRTVKLYTPELLSVSAEVTNGFSVQLIVTGRMLHFDPKVLVAPVSGTSLNGGGLAVAAISTVTPSKITVMCCLLDVVSATSSGESLTSVVFTVSVETAAGSTTDTLVNLSVPSQIVCLMGKDSVVKSWVVGSPHQLLASSVALEPVLASMQTPTSSNLVPHGTTKLLCAMESIAETVIANQPKKKENSFFSLMASKVSGTSTSSGVRNNSVNVPIAGLAAPARDDLLTKVLSEHIARRRPARSFLGWGQWKTRIFSTFLWLDDASYRKRLFSLTDMLDLRVASANLTRSHLATVTLEAAVVSKTVDFLLQSTPSLSFFEPLTQTMSFDHFYRLVHPLLVSWHAERSCALSSPNDESGLIAFDLLREAADLWLVGLMLQLRMQYFFSRTFLVCAPTPGCGTSTVINHLKLIRSDEEFAEANHRLGGGTVVRRLVAETLNDAFDVLEAGISVKILFVTEFSDLCGPAAQNWLRACAKKQEDLGKHAAITILLTKLDESLPGCTLPHADDAFGVECVRRARERVMSRIGSEVLHGCVCEPVALKPSVPLLSHALSTRSCVVEDVVRTFQESAHDVLLRIFRM